MSFIVLTILVEGSFQGCVLSYFITVCSKSMSTKSFTIRPVFFSIFICPGLGQYGAQGGGGTLAGLVEAGVGDFAFVPFGVTPFMGLPAMPVAICWLLMTECASKPETKFLHLHFLIRLQSFISS